MAVQETLSCSSWNEQFTDSCEEATGVLIDVGEGVLSFFRSVDAETGVGGGVAVAVGGRAVLVEGMAVLVEGMAVLVGGMAVLVGVFCFDLASTVVSTIASTVASMSTVDVKSEQPMTIIPTINMA